LQGQGEQIRTEKILPEIAVNGGVGKVNIRPDNQAFTFRGGGTLKPLKEFEAKDNGGLDLRVEGIDKTDVGVNGGVTVGGRGRRDGGDGEDVDSSGAEIGGRGGILESRG
jgi:hypothetical protein